MAAIERGPGRTRGYKAQLQYRGDLVALEGGLGRTRGCKAWLQYRGDLVALESAKRGCNKEGTWSY